MKLLKPLLKLALLLLVVAAAGIALAISYDKNCSPSGSEGTITTEVMNAVTYHCYGGPEVLRVSQVEKPKPGEDEVLVKVFSAGVNPLDWHYMRGSPYFMRLGTGLGAPQNPRLGTDFAGVVESVGARVTLFKSGDRVFGGHHGAFAQYLSMKESAAIAQMPDNISFDQAGSVAIAGISALQSLRDLGQLRAGQKVLINGASGGVGTFAVQIARAMGAEVTGVSSTRNHELLQSLGADYVIDYKKQNYTAGTERYDLIVDMIGNHSPLDNAAVLKPTGRLVMVGGAKGDWLGPAIGPLKAALQSPFVNQELKMLMASLSTEAMEQLAELIGAGKVAPVMDRSYPLSQIRDAIAYSESGRARGKIAINKFHESESPAR